MALKDFGLGKLSLAERVQEEATSLCELFETMEGKVVDVRLHTSKALSNVICSVIFGQR